MLCHHANAAGRQPHERAHGVDADALDEGLEQARVEVPLRPLGHAANGFGRIPAALVRAIRCDGVVHVADGRHARDQRDLVALQPVGVACAVHFFVVVQAGVKHRVFDIAAFLEQVVALDRVAFDHRELAVCELARLVQNGQRDGGLAQVVQQAGHAGAAGVFLAQANLLGQGHHHGAHGHGMHIGVVVGSFQAGQADECAGVASDGVRNLFHQALRVGRVHRLAHARLVEHRNDGAFGFAANGGRQLDFILHRRGFTAPTRQYRAGRLFDDDGWHVFQLGKL